MSEIAKLSILSNDIYIEKASIFFLSLLEEYDFDKDQKTDMKIAFSTALSKTVSKSMAEGELQFVDITFLDTEYTFEISIVNKGIPYETEFDTYHPDQNREIEQPLYRRTMDNAIYKNLGVDGQEIRLIKNLEKRSIFHDVIANQDSKSVPEGTKYSFRKIKQEEVMEITRCIYDEYKYTYISEDIYYPKRIKRLIECGDLYSYVAVTEDGEVAAHTALQRKEAYPMLIDTSIWVVKQKFRNQKLMKKLLPYSLEKGCELNINGIFVEAVTHHPATQKISKKYGFYSTGYMLGYTPGTTEVNYDSGQSRRSLAIGYMPVKEIKKVELYVPKLHEDYIKKVYENIGTDTELKEVPKVLQLCEKTELTVNQNAYRNVAEIDIDNCGDDFNEAILAEKKRLKLDNFSAILLRINMENPECTYIYEKALESRFFFTGIIPHTGNGQVMMMQNLLGNSVDYDNMVAIDDYKECLDYIRQFDPDEFTDEKDPNRDNKMNIEIDNSACPIDLEV